MSAQLGTGSFKRLIRNMRRMSEAPTRRDTLIEAAQAADASANRYEAEADRLDGMSAAVFPLSIASDRSSANALRRFARSLRGMAAGETRRAKRGAR